MRHYDLALFDFDGTLADSASWFRSMINEVAARHGFQPIADDEFDSLRGQPSAAIIRHLGVPGWKMPLIATTMRQLAGRDIDQITLFAGVEALLSALVERGVIVGIVSSNAEANVRHVLGPEAARLVTHFACGASLFGKAGKFRAIMRASKVSPDRVIAIGDETRDLEAARKAGVAAGAVGWGYATIELLKSQKPDYFFLTMNDIRQALIAKAGTHDPR